MGMPEMKQKIQMRVDTKHRSLENVWDERKGPDVSVNSHKVCRPEITSERMKLKD